MLVRRSELVTGRAVLLLVMALTLVPFVSLLLTALHPAGSYPSGLELPSDPQWGNFIEAFEVANMGTLLASSLTIVVGVVPAAVVLATLAGFGLGHLGLPGGRALFVLFLLGLTLPFEGIITPLYYQMDELGLLNTKLGLILPLIALFMPFGVFWMRTHFVNVPPELSEAARVDGASTWQLFWRVHVPLARPALASLAILLFLWTWNQFLLALVLIEDPLQRTMAGGLGAFQGRWGADVPMLSAGSLLILVPTLVVFVLFQRHFVTALIHGSVKG